MLYLTENEKGGGRIHFPADESMTAPDIEFVNLGIRIGKLFQGFSLFGNFYIAMYGVCIALGVVLGATVAFAGGKRNRENGDLYTDFAFIAIILSLIGARVYYVIFQWDYYKQDLKQIFNFRAGGLAIYGGVITAVLTAVIFTKIKKMNFFRMTDNAVPGLILGQAIGRWGNFFNCECFGGYTDNLFAMRIRLDLVRADCITDELRAAMAEHPAVIDGVQYVQVHPTFLYEFLWNIVSFGLMMVFHYSKWKKNDGEVLASYFILYGIGRFWIESLRTDQLLIPHTSIPVSMVVSAILVVLGIGIFVWRRFFAANTLNALNAALVKDHVFFIGGAPKVDGDLMTLTGAEAESKGSDADTGAGADTAADAVADVTEAERKDVEAGADAMEAERKDVEAGADTDATEAEGKNTEAAAETGSEKASRKESEKAPWRRKRF